MITAKINLLPEQPENHRNNYADHHHCCNRYVKFKVGFVDNNIAR